MRHSCYSVPRPQHGPPDGHGMGLGRCLHRPEDVNQACSQGHLSGEVVLASDFNDHRLIDAGHGDEVFRLGIEERVADVARFVDVARMGHGGDENEIGLEHGFAGLKKAPCDYGQLYVQKTVQVPLLCEAKMKKYVQGTGLNYVHLLRIDITKLERTMAKDERVEVRMPSKLLERIDKQADTEGKSRSEMIRFMAEIYLREQEKK